MSTPDPFSQQPQYQQPQYQEPVQYQQPAPQYQQQMQYAYPAVYAVKPPTSGTAVAALITGIAGVVLVWLPWVPLLIGAAALTLGIVAVQVIGSSNRPMGGKGLAVAGIACGGFALVGGVIGLVILQMVTSTLSNIG